MLLVSLNSTITSTVIPLIVHTPKSYPQFHRIQSILTSTTLPFIFIVACIGLLTNTATIVLLSRSFLTNNTRQKWTLIALGMLSFSHELFSLSSHRFSIE